MESGKDTQLTDEDRTRISEAVRAAEQHTRAEIVPMLVSRSGVYRDARHRAGLSLALLVLTGLVTMETAWLPWGWHAANAAWLIAATVAAYAVGAWLGTFGSVIRLVTSRERMREKVRLTAEQAFARHGISQASDRTGVLLLLSMLEHQVYVLPDVGIKQVSPAQWDEVIQSVIERVKAGDIVGGLCAGIGHCGAILVHTCPLTHADNPNDMPDRLIEEP